VTISDLQTPALLLDRNIFEANITRMSAHIAKAGKKLRPHAKAHKCVNIARRQIEAGATGICVATLPEAELMARAGIEDILLTSPIGDPLRAHRIAAISNIAAVVDHKQQVDMYAAAANHTGTKLKLLIDLDVGDHRTGIPPGLPALELAQYILRQPSLSFRGLQAYSVRASHMSSEEGRGAFTKNALDGALETKQLLETSGIEVQDITGGSTGTYADDAQIPYVTEIQAGSYALMDLAYKKIGITEFGNALTVLATVVSANHHDRVTVDAGFKAFATDRQFGPEPINLENATYAWAGDEFGFVYTNQQKPELGDKLQFLPPHCDPNVNLYDRIHVHEGNDVTAIWPIMDRYHAS
jgi:D-serine deaminase-like pyridoxal phosphate-dependent protein